jgi:hypothetical protein
MEAETFEGHPIGEIIAHLLDAGGPGEEIVVLRDERRALLEEAIDDYARVGSPELMHVAQTIFSLADRLEERNAPTCAQHLVAVLNRSNVLGAMQMINERLRNDLGAVEMGTPGDEFASFATLETDRRAPSVGESAPDDAVKLGSLAYPKRL